MLGGNTPQGQKQGLVLAALSGRWRHRGGRWRHRGGRWKEPDDPDLYLLLKGQPLLGLSSPNTTIREMTAAGVLGRARGRI